jgi:antitoxin VapB
MALNIKSEQVERLAAEVAQLTGETKTEAIRRALEERKQRLSFQVVPRDRKAELLRFLQDEVWPRLPPGARSSPLTKAQREALLGIDPERGY